MNYILKFRVFPDAFVWGGIIGKLTLGILVY